MNFLDGEILYIDKPFGLDLVRRRKARARRPHPPPQSEENQGGPRRHPRPSRHGRHNSVHRRRHKAHRQPSGRRQGVCGHPGFGSHDTLLRSETEIDATYPTDHITRELVEEVLATFKGRIEQVPPAYSACKIEGVRAYEYARRGDDVDLKPKILVIDEIELLDYQPGQLTIRVVCSKGTYIRALARDIGRPWAAAHTSRPCAARAWAMSPPTTASPPSRPPS